MKKIVFLIFTVLLSFNAIAQETPKEKKLDIAKLEAEYIANEQILSETELAAYIKINSEFDQKHRVLRREIRALEKSIENITSDTEAEKVMYDIVNKNIALENLDKEYLGLFLKEIPAQKLIKVKSACKKFKGELFKNMHKARENGNKSFKQSMKD
jgi:hypothetical protein